MVAVPLLVFKLIKWKGFAGERFGKDFLIVNDHSLPSPWSAVMSSRTLFWVAHSAVEANWLWGFTCWKGCEEQEWISSWRGSQPGKNRHSCLVHPQPWQHLCLLFPNGIKVCKHLLSGYGYVSCSICWSQKWMQLLLQLVIVKLWFL